MGLSVRSEQCIDEISQMKKNGFTIVELMVSMGILIVLFALTTINLSRLPSATAQVTNIDTLISDTRAQQTKAMSGYAVGTPSQSSYGIHFDSSNTSYTLFRGDSYSESDQNNFIVKLDPNLTFFDDKFTGSQIVFSKGSGDAVGYLAGSDSISIRNEATGEVKNVKINKYGATY